MNAFSSIEDAFDFVKQSPLDGDQFELRMTDNYTFQGTPDRPMGKFTLGMAQLIVHLVQKDFEPAGVDESQGVKVFHFSRIKMSSAAEIPFPPNFSPQRVRLKSADHISAQPLTEIVAYFKDHPDDATDLISECADKRYMPSTFIEKTKGGYREVGFQQLECTAFKVSARVRMPSPIICCSRWAREDGTVVPGLHNHPLQWTVAGVIVCRGQRGR